MKIVLTFVTGWGDTSSPTGQLTILIVQTLTNFDLDDSEEVDLLTKNPFKEAVYDLLKDEGDIAYDMSDYDHFGQSYDFYDGR